MKICFRCEFVEDCMMDCFDVESGYEDIQY